MQRAPGAALLLSRGCPYYRPSSADKARGRAPSSLGRAKRRNRLHRETDPYHLQPLLVPDIVVILPHIAVHEESEQGFRAERHVERAGGTEAIETEEAMALEAPVQNVEVVELQHDGDARQQGQGPARERREQQPIAAVLVVSRAAAQLGVLVDGDVHPHAGLQPADAVAVAQLEDAMVVELEKVCREAAVERVRGRGVRDVERT